MLHLDCCKSPRFASGSSISSTRSKFLDKSVFTFYGFSDTLYISILPLRFRFFAMLFPLGASVVVSLGSTIMGSSPGVSSVVVNVKSVVVNTGKSVVVNATASVVVAISVVT